MTKKPITRKLTTEKITTKEVEKRVKAKTKNKSKRVGELGKVLDEEIMEVYIQNDFNKVATARELGVSCYELYARLKKKQGKLQKMFHQAKEERIEVAESALMKQIAEGDVRAIIFFLKTKGKNWGYSEREEAGSSLAQGASEEARDFFRRVYQECQKN